MITGCDGLGNTCACGIRGVGIFEPLIKSRLKIQNRCTSTAKKKELEIQQRGILCGSWLQILS